ncbi:serine threonine kinase [Fusarium beomiforme]|uniref:Serine threonine kinase n=1 Tax=Fusarium beomiforme TaxID=44412 RepID=A0A9P5AEZ2_9HYPO|nr:serine threonine kinase [Fusarium beomiforme]
MEMQEPPQEITFKSITKLLTNRKTRGITKKQVEEWKDAHCEPFMPRNRIRSYVTTQRVKATLSKLLGIDDDGLAEFVANEAPIAFLTMILVDAVHDQNGQPYIRLLQRHRFSDESFPIRTIDNPDVDEEEDLLEMCGVGSDVILRCFTEWKPMLKLEYEAKQWTFLAPIFRESNFDNEFATECRMPFEYIQNAEEFRGAFGTNQISGKEYTEVAVKFMNINSTSSASDVEKFYGKEGTTLCQMRDMNDPHLIRAIAAYKKGPDRCFIFPWAEGGNLDSLWRTDQSKLDKDLVIWAINQMAGISGGIWKLHEINIRHGDIKPANILCFKDSVDRNGRGTLKIADVGLAKVHNEYTQYRNVATTNRHSSERYEPPEMPSYLRGDPVSRRYDVWSLGCVFLEFAIWLILGWPRVGVFRKDLKDSNTDKFWEQTKDDSPQHHVVKKIINELEHKVPDPSGLMHLIKLISSRLLVPIKARADAKTLFGELGYIQKKCRKDGSYCFGRTLAAVAKKRLGPAGDDPDSVPDQRTINLEFNRTLEDLERDSNNCRMCLFLFQIFSRSSISPTETLNLFTDGRNYSLSSPDSPALISLYLDPDYTGQAPPQAQLGLPILPEVGSTQQFRLLSRWIHLCDATHDCMVNQPHTEKVMPTRVIDVGTSLSPSLRLVETSGTGLNARYLALSHCWGRLTREETFCTYKDTLKSLKEAIPFDKLPRTFRDAVTVTRGLNIQYLWIDSLCIIQEDSADWQAESGKMEDVFNSAYCTIAASSSTSSLDGFLNAREERAVIGIQTPKGPLYLAEAIDDFHKHVEQGILNTRGWVFQERALSRRTIHFTSKQVYWECGQGVHCETLAQLQNRESALLGDSDFPTYGLQKYKDDSIRLVQYLYKTYSELNLTNTTDRSKALLGLEKRLGRVFKSRAEYGVLSVYFERLLLWQVEVPQERILYPKAGRVPSWSWMSTMGKVHYIDIPFGQVAWTGNIKFLGLQTEVAWDGRIQTEANELSIDRTELEKRAHADLSGMQLDPASLKLCPADTTDPI